MALCAVVLCRSVGNHLSVDVLRTALQHRFGPRVEVHTSYREDVFPFAWFFCTPDFALNARRQLQVPDATLGPLTVTVMERVQSARHDAASFEAQLTPTAGALPAAQQASCATCGASLADAHAQCDTCTAPSLPSPPPLPQMDDAPTPTTQSAGYWECPPPCGWVQPSSAAVCEKCRQLRPAYAVESPEGWSFGEWDSSNCGFHNFQAQFTCRRCKVPKPPAATRLAPPPPAPAIEVTIPSPTHEQPQPPPQPLIPIPMQPLVRPAPPPMHVQMPQYYPGPFVPPVLLAARARVATHIVGAPPCFTGPLCKSGRRECNISLLPLREAGAGALAHIPWSRTLEDLNRAKTHSLFSGDHGVIAAERAALVVCCAARSDDVPVLDSYVQRLASAEQQRATVIPLTGLDPPYELLLMPWGNDTSAFWKVSWTAWNEAIRTVPGTPMLGAIVPVKRSLTLQLAPHVKCECHARPTSVEGHAMALPAAIHVVREDGGIVPADGAVQEATFVITPKHQSDVEALISALSSPPATHATGPLLRGVLDGDALWMWARPTGRCLYAMAHLYGVAHQLLLTPTPRA